MLRYVAASKMQVQVVQEAGRRDEHGRLQVIKFARTNWRLQPCIQNAPSTYLLSSFFLSVYATWVALASLTLVLARNDPRSSLNLFTSI